MKGKLKAIPSSLREKKRYVAFEVLSKDTMDIDSIKKAIEGSLKEYTGLLGMSKANLYVLKDKWNSNKNRGILRVNNKMLNELKASFALINEIGGKKAKIHAIGVSGILKKANAKYLS
jgi:ribonuclease P/MRP protein subunit POP5